MIGKRDVDQFALIQFAFGLVECCLQVCEEVVDLGPRRAGDECHVGVQDLGFGRGKENKAEPTTMDQADGDYQHRQCGGNRGKAIADGQFGKKVGIAGLADARRGGRTVRERIPILPCGNAQRHCAGAQATPENSPPGKPEWHR